MERVVALDLSGRTLCFAVLEGSERLIDWGGAEAHRDSEELGNTISRLMIRAQPNLLAITEPVAASERYVALLQVLESLSMPIIRVSLTEVRQEFSATGTTKHQIAVAVGRMFPELGPWLPPPRELWMNRDARMGIFNAVASALALLRERESSDSVT